MAACIQDWPKLVQSVHEYVYPLHPPSLTLSQLTKPRNLVPGGWAEFQDFDLQYYSEDGTLEGSSTLTWINTLLDAARKTGREPSPGPKLEKWVTDAGFTKVTHQRFRFPIGPWAKDPHLKEIGRWNLMQVLGGLEAFSLRLFCAVLGWKREEVLVLLSKVRSELKGLSIHAAFDL